MLRNFVTLHIILRDIFNFTLKRQSSHQLQSSEICLGKVCPSSTSTLAAATFSVTRFSKLELSSLISTVSAVNYFFISSFFSFRRFHCNVYSFTFFNSFLSFSSPAWASRIRWALRSAFHSCLNLRIKISTSVTSIARFHFNRAGFESASTKFKDQKNTWYFCTCITLIGSYIWDVCLFA